MKMAVKKMDWEMLERRIRAALRLFYKGQRTASETVEKVDSILGEETGRGWESAFEVDRLVQRMMTHSSTITITHTAKLASS